MDKTQEEMLYQSLRLKFWLERVAKDEWRVLVPKETMERMLSEVSEMVEGAKRGNTDFIRFFNLYFRILDDVVLYGINRSEHYNADLVDGINAESEVARCLAEELAIYEKRFGKIPKEEIEKELYG